MLKLEAREDIVQHHSVLIYVAKSHHQKRDVELVQAKRQWYVSGFSKCASSFTWRSKGADRTDLEDFLHDLQDIGEQLLELSRRQRVCVISPGVLAHAYVHQVHKVATDTLTVLLGLALFPYLAIVGAPLAPIDHSCSSFDDAIGTGWSLRLVSR